MIGHPAKVLLNYVVCEAVAVRPEGALRTFLSLRIIDTLIMRAADDRVRHDYGTNFMLANESDHLRINIRSPLRGPGAASAARPSARALG